MTTLNISSVSGGRRPAVARAAVLLAMMAVLAAGCKKQVVAPKPEPPVVTVAEAQQRDVQLYEICTGKTVAYQSVKIVPRVKGYLEEMHYTPGEIVHPGQLLFKIQDFDYKINQAKAYADFYQAKTAADLAKALYESAVKTNRLTPNTVTADDMAQKRSHYLSTSTQVYAAQAEYQYQTQQLFYTDITSPIRGKVEEKLVDMGNYVGASLIMETLTTVVEMDPLYVDFEVADSVFAQKYIEMVKKTGGPKIPAPTSRKPAGADSPAPHVMPAPTIPEAVEKYNEADTVADDPAPAEGVDTAVDALVVDATPTIPNPTEKMVPKVLGHTGTGLAGERLTQTGSVAETLSIPFEVGFDEDPDAYPFKGVLIYADNKINPQTGTITIRGQFANPQYEVYPGRVCNVRVPGEMVKNAIVIDERAVNADLSSKYVWVLDEKKVAEKRYVQSLHLLPGGRERVIAAYTKENVKNLDGTPDTVETGLKPGEKYIVTGFQKVRAGMMVSDKSNMAEGGAAAKPAAASPAAVPAKPAEAPVKPSPADKPVASGVKKP